MKPIAFNVALALVAASVTGACSSGENPDRPDVLSPPALVASISPAQLIESPGGEQLFGRVGSAVLDTEGNVYVTDVQQMTVFVLSPSGELRHTIGTAGDGPGEFRIPVAVYPTRDSVYVYDNRAYRVSVFKRGDGSFARSFPLKPDEWHFLSVLGFSDSGVIALATPPVTRGAARLEREASRYSVRTTSLSGTNPKPIWSTEGPEMFALEFNGMPMLSVVGFTTHPGCTLAGGRGYCVHSAISIDVFSLEGDTLDVVRIDAPGRPVTPDERKAAVEALPEPMREKMQFNDTHPAFATPLVVADDGEIWIRRSGSVEDGTEYWVVGPERTTARGYSMEGSVVVHSVRDGTASAVVRAADGSQQVAKFTVQRTRD